MYDAIIVGGGVAGLHTGIEIAKRGISCCILEEYTCGGRVHTYHHNKYHWENGAGRIHIDHYRVWHYLNKYKCTMIPISDKIDDRLYRQIHPNLFHSTITSFLRPLQQLPPHILASKTMKEIVDEVMPHAKRFYETFPYYAEINTLRADIAIEAFAGAIGKHSHFFVCKEGLSKMIDGMKEEFLSLGGNIIEDMRVVSVESVNELTFLHARKKEIRYTFCTSICVLAIPKNALEPLLKIPVVTSVLSHLKMVPLLRIYAIFPKPSWFAGMNSIVVDSPIRYIIPISDEVVMISYTEGPYAAYWMKMKPEEAEKKVMKEIRRLFSQDIPDPIFFKMHSWRQGCTYWLPGNYSPEEMSLKILNPKRGIFACGESYAVQQCWIESALEHADLLWSHPDFVDAIECKRT